MCGVSQFNSWILKLNYKCSEFRGNAFGAKKRKFIFKTFIFRVFHILLIDGVNLGYNYLNCIKYKIGLKREDFKFVFFRFVAKKYDESRIFFSKDSVERFDRLSEEYEIAFN